MTTTMGTMTTARRFCLPLLLALFAGCDIAGCDQEPPVPSGELDRLGDIVLVRPPDAAAGRSFVVVTNPEIQQLRVFDVLERRFVPAPNVFFPLSARTGPATRRLAVSPVDQRFVFALDGALDLLQAVAMVPTVEIDEDSVAPAFTTAGVFETGRAPADVAVWSSGLEGELPLAFVTLPQQSALQVLALDLDAGTTSAELLVDLGEGSRPNRVAVDPTGDAVVVTDAALDSVAIVRVRPEGGAGPLAALDRRIDVGGPTNEVTIGRVDPGGGLAPLALVALRDRPVIAALRMFRFGREDRYELLGSAEIPSPVAALYVPDQLRERPSACCPELKDGEETQDPPTFAWAAVTTTNGWLYYVRLDAADGGLVRLIDLGQPLAEAPEESLRWEPAAGGEARQPDVDVVAIDNFGDPPFVPLLREDALAAEITLTFEATPPGAGNRRAQLVDSGDGFALEVVPASVPFEQLDVQAGDEIVVDTSDRGGSCPASISMTVASISADTVAVSGVDSGDAACLSQGGELRFTLFAVGDFLVRTLDDGYQGRLPVRPATSSLDVPFFRISVTESAAGAPLRGSVISIQATQGIEPVAMFLARPSTFRGGGIGFDALLPQAMVGGPVRIRDVEGGTFDSTRMFLATGTGGLLLFEEATISVEAVSLFD